MLTGVAGSMAYMAPEILVKKGYLSTIDWWSLGICMYELIFGRRPFRGRTNGDLTHSITKDGLRFPDDAEMKCSQRGMQFLAALLERDVTKRLGCKPDGEGLRDIREHPWLSPLDWDKLENKQIRPAFIPDVRPFCLTFSHHFNSFWRSRGADLQPFIHCSPRGQTSTRPTNLRSCCWKIIHSRLSIEKRISLRCRQR